MSKQRKLSYLFSILWVAILFAAIMGAVATGVINSYYSGILVLIGINIILAVSLNLVTGFLGQLVLGHAGFMSVGAYSAALFTMHAGLPISVAFPLGLIFGGLVAAIFGVIIGVPALRLRGDYLAIITLGFGEIIRVLVLAVDFTGGAAGLTGIPYIEGKYTLIIYTFFIAFLTVVAILAFIRSRHGRAVIAIREDEIAAEASGINTTYYKLLAFVVAAFFAGVAGGIYAHYIGVLDPSKFDFNSSVEILIMVVLGGMGSITGSVCSATVLTLLPEMLRSFADKRMLIYSLVLIIVMLFKPTGLLGTREFSVRKIVGKLFKEKKKDTGTPPVGGAPGKEA